MSYKIYSLPLAFLLLSTSVIAKDDNNKAKIEHGFRFGDIKKKKDEDLTKKTQKDLLAELVKLNRKQLKEQKRIREILENEFDPQPKMMTLPDGTKCIENSSAKCFKMPMINEIKRIPVYVDAYQKRDLKSMKKKEMWEGKYVLEVLKLSYLKGQAIRELGPRYPLATRPLGTIDTFGLDEIVTARHRKRIVNAHMKDFEINILLGVNKSLDMYSLVRLAYIVAEHQDWKINLIFKTNDSKVLWEKQYKNFYKAKYLKKLNAVVQPEAFKTLKVYTTPSIFLRDKKRDKNTLIFVGRINQTDLDDRIISYMIQNKDIKRKDLRATEAWKSDSSQDVVKKYYNKNLGIKYEK